MQHCKADCDKVSENLRQVSDEPRLALRWCREEGAERSECVDKTAGEGRPRLTCERQQQLGQDLAAVRPVAAL